MVGKEFLGRGNEEVGEIIEGVGKNWINYK